MDSCFSYQKNQAMSKKAHQFRTKGKLLTVCSELVTSFFCSSPGLSVYERILKKYAKEFFLGQNDLPQFFSEFSILKQTTQTPWSAYAPFLLSMTNRQLHHGKLNVI